MSWASTAVGFLGIQSSGKERIVIVQAARGNFVETMLHRLLPGSARLLVAKRDVASYVSTEGYYAFVLAAASGFGGGGGAGRSYSHSLLGQAITGPAFRFFSTRYSL